MYPWIAQAIGGVAKYGARGLRWLAGGVAAEALTNQGDGRGGVLTQGARAVGQLVVGEQSNLQGLNASLDQRNAATAGTNGFIGKIAEFFRFLAHLGVGIAQGWADSLDRFAQSQEDRIRERTDQFRRQGQQNADPIGTLAASAPGRALEAMVPDALDGGDAGTALTGTAVTAASGYGVYRATRAIRNFFGGRTPAVPGLGTAIPSSIIPPGGVPTGSIPSGPTSAVPPTGTTPHGAPAGAAPHTPAAARPSTFRGRLGGWLGLGATIGLTLLPEALRAEEAPATPAAPAAGGAPAATPMSMTVPNPTATQGLTPLQAEPQGATRMTGIAMNGFYRGAIEGTSTVLGAPVDGVNWVLGRVGLGSANPVGGSESLRRSLSWVYNGYADNVAPSLNATPQNTTERLVAAGGNLAGQYAAAAATGGVAGAVTGTAVTAGTVMNAQLGVNIAGILAPGSAQAATPPVAAPAAPATSDFSALGAPTQADRDAIVAEDARNGRRDPLIGAFTGATTPAPTAQTLAGPVPALVLRRREREAALAAPGAAPQ